MALDAGHRVRIVPGESRNIKITTAFDLAVARSYAEGIEPEGEGGFANA
ncbi:MAG: 2-C-methyl-D-erythritol 4-phosphate cytidylyltransferase [Spirochaetota bacterium]|nr:2-C-methyl-D-erythritol 4-phosphate cytidylyltransferase [Spirochaetota bacterium]